MSVEPRHVSASSGATVVIPPPPAVRGAVVRALDWFGAERTDALVQQVAADLDLPEGATVSQSFRLSVRRALDHLERGGHAIRIDRVRWARARADLRALPDTGTPRLEHANAATLADLMAASPRALEAVAANLLASWGYRIAERAGGGGDGGFDVLAVDGKGRRIAVQCKRWRAPVGVSVIRDLRGAMVDRADVGLLIATSRATPPARTEAARDPGRPVHILAGDALARTVRQWRRTR